MCDRSPDGAQRNPGPSSRISLRSIRATGWLPVPEETCGPADSLLFAGNPAILVPTMREAPSARLPAPRELALPVGHIDRTERLGGGGGEAGVDQALGRRGLVDHAFAAEEILDIDEARQVEGAVGIARLPVHAVEQGAVGRDPVFHQHVQNLPAAGAGGV